MTALDIELDNLSRELPSDHRFEENVVGAAMHSPRAHDRLCEIGLTAGDFHHPRNASIWESITRLADQGKPFDDLSVMAEMQAAGTAGTLPSSTHLSGIRWAANTVAAEHHARKVIDYAAKRRTIQAGTRIVQAGWAPDADAADCQAIAEAEVARIAAPIDDTTWSPIDEVMAQVSDRYDATASRGGMDGIRWGYTDVDAVMTPMQPGDLAVVVAWAGGGKSLIAANLALDVAVEHGMTAVVHGMEMSRLEFGQRYAAKTGGVRLDKVLDGSLDREERNHFDWALGKVCGAPLIVDEAERVNMSRLRASIRKHRPQLVVVDQIPIMTIDDEKPNREQQLTKLTYELKELAKREGIVIVACAQLNSAPMQRSDKLPTLQDIRESRGIGQAASIVVFLHDPTGGQPEHERSGEIDWIVRKQRMGRRDMIIPLAQQFHFARVADLYRP